MTQETPTKQNKIIKKILITLGITLLCLLCVLVIALLSLRSAKVQSYLAGVASNYLSKELNTTISVDKLHIKFINHLELRGLYIEDLRKDTLLYVGVLNVGIDKIDLKNLRLLFTNVSLENSSFFLRKYEEDSVLNLNFIIDYFYSGDTSTTDTSSIYIAADKVKIKQMHFIYDDFHEAAIEKGVDFSHLNIKELNCSVENFQFINDSILGKVKALQFREKSGFDLIGLSTIVHIDNETMRFTDVSLETPYSFVKADFEMHHQDYHGFSDFNKHIVMDAKVYFADFNTRDIGFFTEELYNSKECVMVSGDVHGTVSRLRGKNLKLSYGAATNLEADLSFDGLPNIKETFILARIKKLSSSKRDIERISLPPYPDGEKLKLPDELDRLKRVSFTGNLTGFISDIVAYGTFTTALGEVFSDLHLYKKIGEDIVSYEGNVSTNSFLLGDILADKKTFNKVAFNLSLQGKGIDIKDIDANLVGKVKHIDLLGYNYKNINLEGNFQKEKFKGFLEIKDENIGLKFNGLIDLSQKLPEYDFIAEISDAKLFPLKLSLRDSSASLSTTLELSMKGSNLDNIEGFFCATNTVYTENDNDVNLKQLDLKSTISPYGRFLMLESDLIRMGIDGKFNLNDLQSSLNYMLYKVIPSNFTDKIQKPKSKENFKFWIDVQETGEFSKVFLPGLVVPEYIKVKGVFDMDGDSIVGDIYSPEIINYKNRFYQNTISFSLKDEVISIYGLSERINIGDSSVFQNAFVSVKGIFDHFQLSASFANTKTPKYGANINAFADIYGPEDIRIRFFDTDITIADQVWEFSGDNAVHYMPKNISIRNFIVSHNNRSIRVNGIAAESPGHIVSIDLNNFDLEILNIFTLNSGLTIKGRTNGRAEIKDIFSEPLFTSNIDFYDLAVNGKELGKGKLASSWDNAEKRLGISAIFNYLGEDNISLMGSYFPNNETENFDLRLALTKFPIDIINPWVENELKELKGSVSGVLSLRGSSKDPDLSGSLFLDSTSFIVDILNTKYFIERQKIIVEKDWIGFNFIKITDTYGQKAIATGTVFHDHYHDFNYDVFVEPDKFLALNTNATHNDMYYGTAFATGTVNISGYESQVFITVKARTNKGTKIFIPLSGATNVSENDFIVFVNPNEDKSNEVEKKMDFSGVELNFELEVTDAAEIQLIFDEAAGDIIRASGNGDIKLEINSSGTFNMYGNYVLKEGDYLFTLKNIINKKFLIDNGGTITWSGDPLDANIDITTTYRARAPLSDILQDTSATFKRRVPVDCKLMMNDKLLNPMLSFDIELPTTDEATKSMVKSAIPTEEEMNKQIFSLLIMNRFAPPAQGLSSGGAMGATSSDLLANQLTNWLSKSTDIINVGVSDIKTDEIAFALSRNLFNDRLIIETNVGILSDEAQRNRNTDNNIMGDFNIEYKVTDDGRLKAKMFQKSNDFNMVNAINSPYTQGLGLSFQQDFETVNGLMRKIFGTKTRNRKEDFIEDTNGNGG
jgi:hypothetical protein